MRFNLKTFYQIAFWTVVSGVLALIIDVGYHQSTRTQNWLNNYYLVVLAVGMCATFTRYIERRNFRNWRAVAFDLLITFFIIFEFYLYIAGKQTDNFFVAFLRTYGFRAAVGIMFIRELAELDISYKRSVLNPGQLFISSFLVLIILGALLLMLPAATHTGISFPNALFTATSAVCVTGLAVVDTGQFFTLNGQIILLFLIQIGGLGILTFVSYFSYFFKGGSTYENHLTLGDILSSKRIGDVFSTLKYVLAITFTIEGISAVLIYINLDPTLFKTDFDRIWFSIFHAVSAFCNAGFSTLSNSLYETTYRFNYGLQLIISFTFILGALGFPIISNLVSYVGYKIKSIPLSTRRRKQLSFTRKRMPWLVNINSRLTLVTTFSITGVALVLFYILEYNNTLAEHNWFGKIVTAFFGVATPRTAGFNTIDTGAMLTPSVMVIILLMWIGASPSSTGGGIKTSTFAIAILNAVSLARGKNRIEIYGREISNGSVRRAFAVMALSLFVIGLGITLISIVETKIGYLQIAFECFSAYSTVGMSMGITSELSDFSRLILILIMFIGRVSMLSILFAVVKSAKERAYRFPKEEIMIN